jgi:hypothetical protein
VKGKGVQMTSLCPPGQVEQKKRDERASMGSDRGGGVRAAQDTVAYAGKDSKGRGLRRDWGERHVGGREAGGGRWRPARRWPGELHRWQNRGGRENRAEQVLGEEEERGGGLGTCLQNLRITGTLR